MNPNQMLKKLLISINENFSLDFCQEEKLIEYLLQNLDKFSALGVDVIKNYLKLSTNSEIWSQSQKIIIQTAKKCETIDLNIINLFKWSYKETCGLEFVNDDEFLKIINKLGEILRYNLFENPQLSKSNQICCYEILDLFVQVIKIANPNIIFNENLLDIFTRLASANKYYLIRIRIYNEFLLLKLLKHFAVVVRLFPGGDLANRFVRLLVDKLVVIPSNGTGQLFEKLLIGTKQDALQLVDDDGRKRDCLLLIFGLVALQSAVWIDTDDSNRIVQALNSRIGSLNQDLCPAKNWILIYSKDDSKLMEFLSCCQILSNRFPWSFVGLCDVLDELFDSIGYHGELLWQWLRDYVSLGPVLIEYFQAARLSDGNASNTIDMFRQLSVCLKRQDFLDIEFQVAMEKFFKLNSK